MKIKSHSGIRLRTFKSQQFQNHQNPNNSQTLDQINLKPISYNEQRRLIKQPQRIYSKQINPKLLDKNRRYSASAKIISYPTNHYQCWVSSSIMNMKLTGSNFANKIINKLVNIYQHQPKHLYTDQNQIIKNKKSLSNTNTKYQRFTTEPIHKIPQKFNKIQNKVQGSIKIKKMSKIYLQYTGQQLQNYKPLLQRIKLQNQK